MQPAYVAQTSVVTPTPELSIESPESRFPPVLLPQTSQGDLTIQSSLATQQESDTVFRTSVSSFQPIRNLNPTPTTTLLPECTELATGSVHVSVTEVIFPPIPNPQLPVYNCIWIGPLPPCTEFQLTQVLKIISESVRGKARSCAGILFSLAAPAPPSDSPFGPSGPVKIESTVITEPLAFECFLRGAIQILQAGPALVRLFSL